MLDDLRSDLALPDPSVQVLATLEDLLGLIRSDDDIPATRRRNVASALRCIGRVLEMDLAALPADRRWLARRLRAADPARHGVGHKRWQNACSELSFALNRAGESALLPKGQVLTPEWAALYARLTTKQLRNGLCNLVRWCSANGIHPSEVDDDALVRYRDYLDTRLRKDPKRIHRDTCRVWNLASQVVDGWPNNQLTVPSYRKKGFTIPWDEVPDGFREDVERYLNWQAGKDFSSRELPKKPARPKTIRLRRTQVHILVSAAVRSGFPSAELTSLHVLIDERFIRASVQFYLSRGKESLTPYVRDLFIAAKTVASRWLSPKPGALDLLDQITQRLPSRPHGLTAKNRATLRQFDSDKNVDLLLELPRELAALAESDRLPLRRRAVCYQLAVALELLMMTGLRIENLVSLRLDRHLVRPNPRERRIILSLNETEIKNDLALEYPLPEEAVEMLERYLKKYRPLLAPANSPWLFPGKNGNCKSITTLAAQLKKKVASNTGLVLTAHQFRHVLVKLFLAAKPGHYETARRFLGHKSDRTTVRFYSGLESRPAVEHFDRQILDRRKQIPPRKPGKPPRKPAKPPQKAPEAR